MFQGEKTVSYLWFLDEVEVLLVQQKSVFKIPTSSSDHGSISSNNNIYISLFFNTQFNKPTITKQA